MTEPTVTKEYFFCNYCGNDKKMSALKDIKVLKNQPNKTRHQCGSCFETAARHKATDSHRRFNSKLIKTNVAVLNIKGV